MKRGAPKMAKNSNSRSLLVGAYFLGVYTTFLGAHITL